MDVCMRRGQWSRSGNVTVENQPYAAEIDVENGFLNKLRW